MRCVVPGMGVSFLRGASPSPPERFDVCGRAAGFHAEARALRLAYAACAPFEEDAPYLLLAVCATWGWTGNRPRFVLYGLQHARKHGGRAGIMYDS